MKKIIFTLVLLLTNITPTVMAQYEPHIDSVTAKSVRVSLTKYIGEQSANSYWTIEQYKDLSLFLAMKDISSQISKLVDSKSDFRSFKAFGIQPLPNAQISIDLNKYPRWLTIDELFSHFYQLDDKAISFYRKKYLRMGFSQNDFDRLVSYIHQTNVTNKVEQARQKLINKYAQLIRSNYASGVDNTNLIYQWGREQQKAANRIYRDWAVDLLNQFDNQRQRILVTHAHENVRLVTRSPSNVDKKQIATIEQYFIDNKDIYVD